MIMKEGRYKHTYRHKLEGYGVIFQWISELSCDEHPLSHVSFVRCNDLADNFQSNEQHNEQPIRQVV